MPARPWPSPRPPPRSWRTDHAGIFLAYDGRHTAIPAEAVETTVAQARTAGVRGFIVALVGDYHGSRPVTLLQLGTIDTNASDWGVATFAFHAGRVGLVTSRADEDASDAVRGLLTAQQVLTDAEARVRELRF